jgi:integrase
VQFDEVGWGSGHVFRVERRQGPVWYSKYRLPDGRQVKKRIGPAWAARARPRVGYFTRRSAEEWLRERLEEARERAHAGGKRTDATFAEAAREWLRYVEHDRACKPSTLRSYRSTLEAHLLPAFGELALHEITPAHIERWRAGLTGSPRTKNKLLTELYGVVRRAQKVYGLEGNPAAQVEKLRQRRRLDLDVFTPEEVRALCRAADSEQDAALYLTAAFTGLRRGELIALRWRDVDFAASGIRVSSSFAGGRLTAPKSGKVRSTRPRRRLRARPARAARALDGRPTTSSSPAGSAATSTAPHCAAATSRPSTRRASDDCASTTCATPSAPP